MHPFRSKALALAVLCALPFAASAQQGLQLRPQRALIPLQPSSNEELPLFIEADRIQGHDDRETEAEGKARLRKRGQAFFADWMRYDKPEDLLNARGNVRIEQGGDVIEGDRLRYHLGTDRGYMDRPNYLMTPVPVVSGTTASPAFRPDVDARGSADKLLFEGPRLYRVENGSYTTCGPGSDDWYIRAKELEIDKNRDIGTARDASIVFMDRTIFYSPYLSFSLHQQRKSGVLTPHYGSSSTSGAELTVPYYWNIAPNRDATFYPRYMTKRGLQLGTEFRYLEPSYRGDARIEYLPSDQQISRDRHAYFYKHQQSFASGWSGWLNLNRVSDGRYFTDLSTLVAVTSQSTLPSEGSLSRGGTWANGGTYGFSIMAQRWQTLQSDVLAPITPPYNRQPQVSLVAQHSNLGYADFDLLSSFVDFGHPTLVSGRRAVAYPSFSVPLQTSYAYLTPKLGAHITRYAMGDNNAAGLPNATRTLPIASAESGLVLERDTRYGGMPFIQTLEPKLYYVYIPFRDQSRLPNFDSGLQDVSFATIFSENQFSGNDRINDANQMTFGVTSRLIHPDSGVERLRVGLAQRYYFQGQQVSLPGVAPRSSQSSSSDLLAALSGTIAQHWTAEGGWQYNTDLGQTQRLNVGTRYQPAQGKVLNLAYRNTINSVKQTDMSFQWPVGAQWTAVGRWNWSIRDGRTLEALGGMEYNGGCWALRVVAHRFATATQAASTSLFVQLELNGISRIGSNPLDVIRRNVTGYSRPDPRAPRSETYHQPAF